MGDSPRLRAFCNPVVGDLLEKQALEEGTEASPRMRVKPRDWHHGGNSGDGTGGNVGPESGAIPEDREVVEEEEGEGNEVGADLGGRPEIRWKDLGGKGNGSPAVGGAVYPHPALPRGGGGSLGTADLGSTGAARSCSPGALVSPHGRNSGSKFAPLPWSDFFDESFDITMDNGDVFHMYKAGNAGPVALCLHGGGFTGLSFAVAAARMKQQVVVLAPDLRGHGLTRTSDDDDLSVETLCSDVVAIVEKLYPSDPPAIVLVGHSMGGAIAVRTAALQKLHSLCGLVVIDVVEGTALASLAHMEAVLAARPTQFPTVDKAIEWSLRGGHLRNPDSARASVPSCLKYDEAKRRYVWRTALENSEKHWRGWYSGLSDVFLHCSVPKVLLLAGTDRLDKALTIAQMQGKFQMLVVRHSGHAIQEDEPDEFASAVLHFIARNRITERGVTITRWGSGGATALSGSAFRA